MEPMWLGQCPCKKDIRELPCPFHSRKNMTICEQRSGPPLDTKIYQPLHLGPPSLQNCENKFLLFISHPVYGICYSSWKGLRQNICLQIARLLLPYNGRVKSCDRNNRVRVRKAWGKRLEHHPNRSNAHMATRAQHPCVICIPNTPASPYPVNPSPSSDVQKARMASPCFTCCWMTVTTKLHICLSYGHRFIEAPTGPVDSVLVKMISLQINLVLRQHESFWVMIRADELC
jgi:hypothetical protein